MGGLMTSDVETVKFKLLQLSALCTMSRELNMLGAKFKVDISIHKATQKKQIEEKSVFKKGLGPVLPAYEPLVLDEGKIDKNQPSQAQAP